MGKKRKSGRRRFWWSMTMLASERKRKKKPAQQQQQQRRFSSSFLLLLLQPRPLLTLFFSRPQQKNNSSPETPSSPTLTPRTPCRRSASTSSPGGSASVSLFVCLFVFHLVFVRITFSPNTPYLLFSLKHEKHLLQSSSPFLVSSFFPRIILSM